MEKRRRVLKYVKFLFEKDSDSLKALGRNISFCVYTKKFVRIL